MECTACGSENDEDARFCKRCAVELVAPRQKPDAAAAEPSGVSGGARVLGIVAGVLAIGVGVMRLADRPTARIEAIEAPSPITYREPGAPAAATIRRAAAERAPSESERTLAGTWVARVGPDAPRRASTEGFVTQIGALQQGLVNPVARCLWIELYDNLRGFEHECGVVNGEPSVLGQTDPFTGRQSDVGVALRWRFADGALHLTYDADLLVGGVRVRELALALPQGSSPFDVTVAFPGHDEVPAQTHSFEAFPGRYLGDGSGD